MTKPRKGAYTPEASEGVPLVTADVLATQHEMTWTTVAQVRDALGSANSLPRVKEALLNGEIEHASNDGGPCVCGYTDPVYQAPEVHRPECRFSTASLAVLAFRETTT